MNVSSNNPLSNIGNEFLNTVKAMIKVKVKEEKIVYDL